MDYLSVEEAAVLKTVLQGISENNVKTVFYRRLSKNIRRTINPVIRSRSPHFRSRCRLGTISKSGRKWA